jgi:excisionase family DNA binding protein
MAGLGTNASEDKVPNLLTVAEVAELLRCSTKTIYRRVACGEIPAIQDGGRFLFNVVDIRALLIARLVRPKSKSTAAFTSDSERASLGHFATKYSSE